jgi:multidrug efflux pump subunit AcrA (membrane-fusion protein)
VPKANAEQAMRNRLESENLINAFTSNYLKQTEVDLAEAQKRREALQLQLEAAKFDEEKASILSPIAGANPIADTHSFLRQAGDKSGCLASFCKNGKLPILR